MGNKGQDKIKNKVSLIKDKVARGDFVLEKSIFSNIFDKDIKRVFIYKKAERLARALHLITPAFRNSPSLRDRVDAIAVGLVDAAILPPALARERLSRELLALSSVLSIAETGGMLSPMNAEIIARESHVFLQEIASYEEPRLFLEESPSLAELLRASASAPPRTSGARATSPASSASLRAATSTQGHKGQDTTPTVKDKTEREERRNEILSIIQSKGQAYIKDLSTVIRNVSEKTIQRELSAMVAEGILTKKGERRWTSYMLAA